MTTATVRSLMTPLPHTIGSEQPVTEAAHRMRLAEVRHLPVLEGGRLVGVITDRDVRVVEAVARGEHVKVWDVMSPEPYAVSPDEDLATVVKTMSSRKLGSAIVMDGNHVVGIFTTIDALQLLGRYLSSELPEGI